MDNGILNASRVERTRQQTNLVFLSPPPKGSAGIEERRGEVMRRLFPMHSVGRARERETSLARQVYAYFAEATTSDELDRRIGMPLHYPTEWIERVRLRDQRTVLVRPVLPTGAAMLRLFVRSLSATTRGSRVTPSCCRG